jgi:hypothetical protein
MLNELFLHEKHLNQDGHLLLQMEVANFSETPLHFYQTTRSHIPEDGTVSSSRIQNLKFHTSTSIH